MKRKNLDKICTEIIFQLFTQQLKGVKELRFKELAKELRTKNPKLADATLADHLKHLTSQKIVIRTVKDVKNVTYRLNPEWLKSREKTLEVYVEWEKFLKTAEKRFYEGSIEEQLGDALRWSLLCCLGRLKSKILYYGEKQEPWYYMMRLFELPIFREFETWILKKAVKDEEYRKAVLREIEKNMKQLGCV